MSKENGHLTIKGNLKKVLIYQGSEVKFVKWLIEEKKWAQFEFLDGVQKGFKVPLEVV